MVTLEIQEQHASGSDFLTIVDGQIPPPGTIIAVKANHPAARPQHQGTNVYGKVEYTIYRPQGNNATVFLSDVKPSGIPD